MHAPVPSQPPEAVLDALREAGLEPDDGVLSQGGGHVWCARSVEGVRFRVRVVPSSLAGTARARALRLAALDPLVHLARVAAPVSLADGALLLLEEEVQGVGLDLLDGPWDAGEVTAVLVCAANALAALHAAGLPHGRVRLRHLVRRYDGAVVLSGLLGSDVAHAGDPAQDVTDLVRLGLDLLEDTAAGEQRDTLVFALTEMPPGADAQAVAERAVRACPARPVRAGDQTAVVDELRRLARRRRGPGGAGPHPRGGAARRRTRGRHAQRGKGVRAPVVVATVGVLGAVSVALALGAGGAPPPASANVSASAGLGAVAGRPGTASPVQAAQRLTTLRAEALAAGDASLLASVTVPGSPAARADAAAVGLVDGVDVGTLRVEVHDAVLLEQRDGVARVEVTASAGVRPVGEDGAREEAPARTVVLELHEGYTGWRVHDVLG